jgi:hypothetical protein
MHMLVSYVLTVAVMLPASGWLADRVGVRNIFFTAIVLFTARQDIGDDDHMHMQRTLPEAFGHRGEGGVDDGGVHSRPACAGSYG